MAKPTDANSTPSRKSYAYICCHVLTGKEVESMWTNENHITDTLSRLAFLEELDNWNRMGKGMWQYWAK